MKITRVESIRVAIPFEHGGPPTGFGGKVWTTLETLLVRVETDGGLTGWGEAFGYNVNAATQAAIDALIAPLCVGQPADDIGGLNRHLQRTLHNFGRGGPVLFGISGIDIALWDLAGKAAGQPLHRLLGGTGKSRLPAYASLMRYADPVLVGRIAARAAGEGYRHIKLHEVAGPEVRAAREAVGPDAAIMVDTNCPWTVTEAIEMARALAPYRLLWLEEPVWPPEDWAGLAAVARAGGIPLAAGENAGSLTDFVHMLGAGAVTYAQPSVTKIGGVTEMRKVMALAEASGACVMPHAPYFGPGFLATLHLVAAAPGDMLVERLYVRLQASLFEEAIEVREGFLGVPAGPGLGVDPDPAVVERYRIG